MTKAKPGVKACSGAGTGNPPCQDHPQILTRYHDGQEMAFCTAHFWLWICVCIQRKNLPQIAGQLRGELVAAGVLPPVAYDLRWFL